ncbi:MAG TPA: cytochrome c oxidase subunit II [Opitutaceae bacterium]|nr:cytochrome c oxidase subunit II [Opitutaceae bacterium]
MHLPPLLRTLGRMGTRALVLASPLLLAGCDLNFLRMDGHQSTIFVNGPVAREQRDLFYVTCWVTLVLFILVGSVLAYATLKFKARTEADEHAEPPEQGHGNPLVEIGLIAASVFALVIIAIPTLKAIWYTYDVPEADQPNAYEVTATGYQWWFKFEYPSEKIDGVGPLATSNELVIPAGRPVHINLRTTDVIHSFWVPKLAGKVDMIPNRGNRLWLQADAPGYFWGQCAEYCGDSHAVMRFRVIALNKEDFAAWLTSQKAGARTVAAPTAATDQPKAQFAAFKEWKRNEPGYTDKYDRPDLSPLDNWKQQQLPNPNENPALIAQGRKLFQEKTCIVCHTIRGHEGIGVTAPNLTHVGARTTIAAGLLENNPEQLARWIRHPDQVKPGNKMYYGIGGMAGYMKKDDKGNWVPNITLTDENVTALVAYLSSLK